MSDAEEDYLSDKFLAESLPPSSSAPLGYAERRRKAQKESEIKNAQNRKKRKHELEEESRREGLSKSLFERAKEDEEAGTSGGNKAMAMMLKMGYKPGQSLGRTEVPASKQQESSVISSNPDSNPESTSRKASGHLVEPLPLDVWSGRMGVGKRKRAVSPIVAGKLAKMVQESEEEQVRGSFRDRARQEYEEKRAQGRFVAARRTCVLLDEKAGIQFNIICLDPQEPETFPSDLLEALTSELAIDDSNAVQGSVAHKDHLRQQMRADALQPLSELDAASPRSSMKPQDEFSPKVVEEARKFIRSNAQRRLELLLGYLREKYFYCFWCGTQYTDVEDLQHSCPGLEEDDHD